MGRLCTICTHAQRQDIDEALLVHAESYRKIAMQFDVTETALWRHEQTHLHHSLKESKALGEMLSADNLLEKLGTWHARMEAQYEKADAQDNVPAAVATGRTGIAAVEAFARIGPLSEV